MSKKLALGHLKVGDYFIYDGKEYKDKKVRRIYIDTLVEKAGGIDEDR